MTDDPNRYERIARTCPPAKLNLFLELRARRDDGFHEIDTVMVPIDWRDELSVQRIPHPQIEMTVQWLPSEQIVAQRLGIKKDSPTGTSLLDIPNNDSNLVHRALTSFQQAFEITDGFSCHLGKRIPAGAGLGGASSDAASALRCAAALCGIPLDTPQLTEIATTVGSDVPFFLGLGGKNSITGVRATGRGEHITPIEVGRKLDFVVIFPAISLSTAKVYAHSQIPVSPRDATDLVEQLRDSKATDFSASMLNRLTGPAKKLAPQIGEILESLWQADLRMCQLTGSGSACFAIATSSAAAQQTASRLQSSREPGAIVMPTQSTQVPARIDVT